MDHCNYELELSACKKIMIVRKYLVH